MRALARALKSSTAAMCAAACVLVLAGGQLAQAACREFLEKRGEQYYICKASASISTSCIYTCTPINVIRISF